MSAGHSEQVPEEQKTSEFTMTVGRSGERILQRAKDFTPAIVKLRDEIERTRALPAELVLALQDADIFRMWYPSAWGGPELSIAELGLVLETLSYADGAVGWCAGIGSAYSRFAGYLPEPIARRIFEGDVVAGSLAPTGKGVKVPGGYRVTGRWKWGSGITHSNWVLVSFVTHHGGERLIIDGEPELRVAFFPKTSHVEIIDTWNVTGLRGTGSYDYATQDLFVPDDYTLVGLDPPPHQSTSCYEIPLSTAYPFVIAAVPLGMVMAAFDEFLNLAQEKAPVSSPTLLRDKPTVQAMIGRSRAMLLSAREFYYATAQEITTAGDAHKPLTFPQRARARLAAAQVAEVAKQVVRDLYDAAGGSSVYANCQLERNFRDIHAAAQHVQVSPNNFEFAGRVLLGLPPGTARF
jgi:alkylation response protein AidB-like acyl-CoA dehydrogenase